jgi:hypothetical protein
MKTPEKQTDQRGGFASGVLLGARDWKEIRRKWNREHPESMKAAQKRLAAKRREQGIVHTQNECRCLSCGMIFNKDEALLRGFKTFKCNRDYRVICDECA